MFKHGNFSRLFYEEDNVAFQQSSKNSIFKEIKYKAKILYPAKLSLKCKTHLKHHFVSRRNTKKFNGNWTLLFNQKEKKRSTAISLQYDTLLLSFWYIIIMKT